MRHHGRRTAILLQCRCSRRAFSVVRPVQQEAATDAGGPIDSSIITHAVPNDSWFHELQKFHDELNDGFPAVSVVRNQVGVQLLSPVLHDQVFGTNAFPPLDRRALKISKTHLERHGLATKESPIIKQTDFTLPKLQGNNIEEHFYNIGSKHSEPYRRYAEDLSKATLPPQPDTWQQLPGWTRYEQDGAWEPVDSPPDNALVFDVETLYKVSSYPVMAVAASETHWYGWASPWLLGQSTDMVQLIPFSSKKAQLIVGHNVGYDRARIREEYSIEKTEMRFLDTMALHVAVRGLSSHQRIPWMKHRKRKKKEEEEGLDFSVDETSSSSESATPSRSPTSSRKSTPSSSSSSASAFADGAVNKWEDVSSMNSLVDVAKLHCDIDIDKSARDWFSSEDPQEIVDQFQELMTYCANDVLVTHKVFKVVLPAFTQACPNPVSFAGVLHMGSSFLPVDDSWERFIDTAESLYQNLTKGVETELYRIAEEARKMIFKYDKDGRPIYESDPWLRQLDWTPKKARPIDTSRLLGIAEIPEEAEEEQVEVGSDTTEAEDSGFESSCDNANTATSTSTAAELPEESDTSSSAQAPLRDAKHDVPQPQASSTSQSEARPAWHKSLFSRASGQITQTGWDQIVPLLLTMSWKGYPLRYSLEEGWFYAVPKANKKAISALPNQLDEQLAGTENISFRPFAVIKRSMLSSRLKLSIQRKNLGSSSHLDFVEELCELGLTGKDGLQKARKRPDLQERVLKLADAAVSLDKTQREADPWLSQLDWTGWEKPITNAQIEGNATPASGHDIDSPAIMQEGSPNLSEDAIIEAASPLSTERRKGTLFDDDSTPSTSQTRSFSTTPSRPNGEEPVRRSSRLFSGSEDSSNSSPTESATTESVDEESFSPPSASKKTVKTKKATPSAEKPSEKDLSDAVWPHWYWHMWRPRKDAKDQGAMDLSIRSKAAPLLLKLTWQGYPLASSRQHGWLYRVPKTEWQEPSEDAGDVPKPVEFQLNADINLEEDTEHLYFKLPHKDGAEGNVGTPLSKAFMPAFEEGILSSEYPAASKALDMNAQCSYWISARERVKGQLVVWEKQKGEQGFPTTSDKAKHGMILPQVVTMGTVTRRAVESTWLAASNAKKNRLGSELKAMIRAPEGWKIIGADVDSEELWICCVMGDAQFGVHGATAIGWMTLEGTKSAGTDLHSKTASILGISRDKAKVFNYSRIYGAGVKHATQLLLQSNPKLTKGEAENLAKTLYASTKGLKQHSVNNRFERKFWHGGTESHVFNTLEAIAMAADPRTPALGCGITAALAKANLPKTEKSRAGEDFMPSRINWVVQSSGVDYLHLLIVSMEYLCKKFGITARFMISVHDEIRYLVKEEDQHRAALALQISNLWTRALFSYKLQMESLPQSCAFFSAVDLDHVLRKEVNMDCVTPSQKMPIPHGKIQTIEETIEATNNGSLYADGRPMSEQSDSTNETLSLGQAAVAPSAINYRCEGFEEILFLEAQNATSKEALSEVFNQRNDHRHELDWDTGASSAARYNPSGKTSSSASSSRAAAAAKRVGPPITSLPTRRAPEREA